MKLSVEKSSEQMLRFYAERSGLFICLISFPNSSFVYPSLWKTSFHNQVHLPAGPNARAQFTILPGSITEVAQPHMSH